MQLIRIALFLALAVAPALAQQNNEQLYREINSALAQDNRRLGLEVDALQRQISSLEAQIKTLGTPAAPPPAEPKVNKKGE